MPLRVRGKLHHLKFKISVKIPQDSMLNSRTSSKSGSSLNSAQPKMNNRGRTEKVQVRMKVNLRVEGIIEGSRSLTIKRNRKNIVHLITKRMIKVGRE